MPSETLIQNPQSKIPNPKSPIQNINVLLVEDNPGDVDLIRERLSGAGAESFGIESVPRLSEALARLKGPGIDVVLLDLGLPDSTGLETLVKLHAAAPDLPVIVLTGNDDQEAALAAVREGAQDYLIKGQISGSAIVRSIRYGLERSRIAAALQEIEDSFRFFYDNSPVGKSITSCTGAFNPNRALCNMLGYSGEELKNRRWQDITHPDDIALTQEAVDLLLSGKKDSFRFQKRYFRKDFSVLWAELHTVLRRDSTGKPLYFMSTIIDITERVQNEAIILNNAREWSASFDAMADGVSIHSVDHTILNANEALLQLLGKTAEEVIGKKCFQIFHGKECPVDNCPLHRTKETIQKAAAEVFEPTLDKILHISTAPVFDGAGVLQRIVHTVRDLTEQRKVESQLRQSHKMEAIGTLAGGIAHDFNNILSAILGFGEIVMEQLPEGSPLREDQAHIIAGGKRASELVRQILTFSRRTEQVSEPLLIQYVVKEALKLLRASIPTSITIREDIDVSCRPVLADPVQIHQVVMNLCTNAYHAMRETAGMLSVSLKSVVVSAAEVNLCGDLHLGPYLCLEISDTGCGMTRAVRERIFEPYFTTKVVGDGTGLGLSMVHGIVTGLGGGVYVQSEPGQGTTCKVYLPLIARAIDSETVVKNEVLPGGAESILVVDDEAVIGSLECRILAALGYRVTFFSDSEEAWQAFRNKPDDFDLLLTDMTMPKLNGNELATKILQLRPGLPIILCTGFSHLIDAEKAKALGISEFMAKPVEREELAKAVRKALDGGTNKGKNHA